MERLAILTLATVYLTYLAMFSEILNLPRSYVLAYTFGRRLLNCPVCTGFWMAIVAYLLPPPIAMVLAVAGANFIFWSYQHED